ncbi:hypothetical protein EMN47_20170 [Prolixibacteraceae bacterium JC049]|nr:hypothetical protein [Prolixibacteraceae bacterium JC049]
MNNIQAIIDKSDYEIYGDYLNFLIDDYFLDEKLDEIYPEQEYKGLVPTLNWWMEIPQESKVVWDRILPETNNRSICPILMCPDDADFSCTLIVADILRLENAVVWERLGIDMITEYEAEKIGSKVDWFDKIKPLSFDIHNYEQMISDFKECFEKDKKKYLKENNLNDW